MENIKDYMPESPDFNQERLDKLKELFPDLFTSENKLNTEELKKLVDPDSISETERYEFRWFGKSNAKRNAFTPSNATLIYDEERSVNPTESENLIIEGENLEVLKLLSAAYREKIKCIYIDPPYNTGKDFVYSDNFTQDKKAYWEDAEVMEDGLKIDTNTETDGRYHSNWLNMMYSRLLVARQLLREDGMIFISIDDNEVHHLRKLGDEVFGESNFVAQFVWQSKKGGGSDSTTVVRDHEYVLCFSKNIHFLEIGMIELNPEPLDKIDEFGPFRRGRELNKWGANSRRIDRPTMWFPIPGPNKIEVYPIKNDGTEGCWRFGKINMMKFVSDGNVEFNRREDGFYTVYEKIRTEDARLKPFRTFLTDVNATSEGSMIVRDLFEGEKVFSFPKPLSLLKSLLEIGTTISENDIVLDFFSGSGTTAHAVMQSNEEDGRNLKYICVQIPEFIDEKSDAYKAGYKKISDITIERNKRVIENLIAAKNAEQPDLFTDDNKVESLKGLGFKVFKLAKSNFPRVDFAPDPTKTDAENVELLKKYIAEKEAQLVNAFNREELLTEILLKKGFNLNYTAELQSQFTKNEVLLAQDGEKQTLICLDVSIESETVEYFKTHKDKKFICLERALDTTKKYNLKHYLGELVDVF